ncbi:hypothetical protein BC835DRAFT_1311973 [Cytidiella melzeri]|nr:hypothetical protein BC835DRAFT_1311973 [Cytidiella melzeri]
MPADVAAAPVPAGLPRSRPSTRSSIRHSLTLANVGKALADVMHKENKESVVEKEKGSKKSRAPSSRRSGAVPVSAGPGADKAVSSGRKDKEVLTEVRTITRSSRRISALQVPKSSGIASSDDQSSSSPSGNSPKRPLTRSSSLKPRSSAGSALPKYRPKSVLIEADNGKAPPSPPPRVGSRRRLSDSGDEKEDSKPLLNLDIPQVSGKNGRAISPLPHRGALKVNLTAAINVHPATPEKKTKPSTPTPTTSPSQRQASPTRLPTSRQKASKTAQLSASTSPTAAAVAARPPSSASSTSSSRTPHTPSTPTIIRRITERSGGSARSQISQGASPSPLRSAIPPHSDSPLAHASVRRRNQNPSPTPSPSPSRLMPLGASRSLISTPGPMLSADSSMDSIDAGDVEFMLSSAVSPSAPTPALPRFRTIRVDPDENPHTPPRNGVFLPTRSNMSYLSPAPYAADGSPFLRPRSRQPGNDRGSILSWEQLAQHSRTMGQEDLENMLYDIDAPFRSATASPAPSTLSDIPESPSLSALPSPTGYGSISQVLLPEVTPSPAIFNATLRFDQMAAESPVGDGGAVTMLRLQLAAAESAANEQRLQIEALSAQLQSAKEARLRDTEDLARQVTFLEEQVQGSLRPVEQLQQYAASLEEQLASAHAAREQAVGQALQRAQRDSVKAQEQSLKAHYSLWTSKSLACQAYVAWGGVKSAAESELDYVRSSRETLSVLLAGLDHTFRQF